MNEQRLIAVVGPTCTGKTRFGVGLAQHLGAAELINADSRQLRRGLHVGTCAPTRAELGSVRCHLLDQAEPGEDYSVAQWVVSAVAVLDDMQQRGTQPILVGGTGLYVTALIDGYDFAAVAPDPGRRAERTRLAETGAGRAQLAAEIRQRDPDALTSVDVHNPRRLIRALEIIDERGRLQDTRGSVPRPALMVGLDVPKPVHQRWVELRCVSMFAGGAILDETAGALERGYSRAALDAAGIGYREAIAVLDGSCSAAQAVAASVRRTLRYAKAQRTYFRRDQRVNWLDATGDAVALIEESLTLLAAEDPAIARR